MAGMKDKAVAHAARGAASLYNWYRGKGKKKKKKKKPKTTDKPMSFSEMNAKGIKGYADSLKRASYGSFEDYEKDRDKASRR